MIPINLTNIEASNELRVKSDCRDVSMIPINLTNIEASNELRVRSDCRDASNQSGIRSFFVKFRVILWKNIFRR